MAVINVAQDQVQDTSGNFAEAYTITFTIPNHTGTFTVTVAAAGDPVANAHAAIDALTQQVEGIYGL